MAPERRLHLRRGVAVYMWVIPVHSRRLVGRNLDVVLKRRIAGLNDGIDHIVLVTYGGNIQTVEMNVGRSRHDLLSAAIVVRPGCMMTGEVSCICCIGVFLASS